MVKRLILPPCGHRHNRRNVVVVVLLLLASHAIVDLLMSLSVYKEADASLVDTTITELARNDNESEPPEVRYLYGKVGYKLCSGGNTTAIVNIAIFLPRRKEKSSLLRGSNATTFPVYITF